MDSGQHLDPEIVATLLELAAGDLDFLHDLVETFVAETTADLATLPHLFARGDAEEVSRLAHRCRGRSANVGALRLAELWEQVRRRGGGGGGSVPRESTADLLAALASELVGVASALRRHAPR
ncbi:MAG: Hpt domain-containing protein [Candidatus Schekmanbacteria bacterium]|nr:Hpt domain-containing protein [Candidatus Schekmanbacteria bacterium]